MSTWLIRLIGLVLTSLSEPLRAEVVESVERWELRARETKSPWDDILVDVVKWLLGIT